MAIETSNSERRIYKATYVTQQTDPSLEEVHETKVGRGVEKMFYARSLAITPEEATELRRYRLSREAQTALFVIEEAAADPTPAALSRFVPALASTPHNVLVSLGEALVAVRRDAESRALGAREGILQARAEAPFEPRRGQTGYETRVVAQTPAEWLLHRDVFGSAPRELPRTMSYEPAPIEPELLKPKMTYKATEAAIDGFRVRMTIQPIGWLHLERVQMNPVGIERGALAHSVPLAPKETVNISHKEWSVRVEDFEKIVQDSFEGFSEEGVSEKNDIAQATESQSRHQTALNLGASLSASYSSVTLSTSFGFNKQDEDQNSRKDSIAHSAQITRKASARTRKDHKMTFKVTSVAGTEDQAVRVITNPSDSNAMRVDYYQLMRKWRVDLFRYGLRMTYDIVVPNPGSALMQKLEEIRLIDAELASPYKFELGLEDVTRADWANQAATYHAPVEQPPLEKDVVESSLIFRHSDQEHWGFETAELDVDPRYVIEAASFGAEYSPLFPNDQQNANPMHDRNSWFGLMGRNPSIGWSGDGGNIDSLKERSGKISVPYKFFRIVSGVLRIKLELKLRPEAWEAWRIKAWNTLRQADEEAHFQSRQTLRDRRAKLVEELGGFDALTLRRMEQEEVMKGVLRWLFGPTFDYIPVDVQALFAKSGDGSGQQLIEIKNDAQWLSVLTFGEFIKYIHQAIEWESVLYFTYPYFWDHRENWNAKLFLNHPDSIHRMFLRSGSARVVLTIRPGFEKSFAQLMEQGAFGQTLPPDHPYFTIANEIQAYARTNYAGIPPANPVEQARPLLLPIQKKAWEQLQGIMALLEKHKTANGAYPTTAQGLAALSAVAGGPISAQDPWGRSVVYKCPGDHGDFDLASMGADGAAGGEGENADITSWAEASLIGTWFEYTPTSALDISLNTVLAELS